MNQIHNFNVNLDLCNTGSNFPIDSSIANNHTIYEDISPLQQHSTPVSNDSSSDKHNRSTASSKKSESSHLSIDEANELTVDSLERTITEDRASKIDGILCELATLSEPEKLLIQLRFPLTEIDNFDESNGDFGISSEFGVGGNQNEHKEASTWIMSHLEEDQTTCLKKQEVYEDYKSYCLSHNVKYLSTADFGKVMKKTFPNMTARRLGARGQSKYCYSGLKIRNEIKSPTLSDVGLCCTKSTQSLEVNSDLESISSASHQHDLSNLPEYELGSNIIVDCALVVIDFIKSVTQTKTITSIKQTVEHLLVNNQVDMSSAHVRRLMPFFQEMESFKTKRKYLQADHIINNIKKEETYSSPKTIHSSPQQAKAPKPVVYSHTPPHSTNQNGMSYNNIAPKYYDQRAINTAPHNMGHQLHIPPNLMSPNMTRKQFQPNTYSTPIKDSSLPVISPSLNSPLLERNPTTTKKLELSNLPKSLHKNPTTSYSHMQQRTPIVDRSSQMPMYNSPHSFSFDPNQANISYLNRDVTSPITMTSRNYGNVSNNDEYYFDNDLYDEPPLKTRHIGNISQSLSPCLNYFDGDNYVDFGQRQQSCEVHPYLAIRPRYVLGKLAANAVVTSGHITNLFRDTSSLKKSLTENRSALTLDYLTTPLNSPTNASTDQELSETSSRNNTPQNISGHFSFSSDSVVFNPSSLTLNTEKGFENTQFQNCSYGSINIVNEPHSLI